MSAIFQVQLDAEGEPEPMFCSVCHEWRELIVYFLSGNIEVSLCNWCITTAASMLVDLLERKADSRA